MGLERHENHPVEFLNWCLSTQKINLIVIASGSSSLLNNKGTAYFPET